MGRLPVPVSIGLLIACFACSNSESDIESNKPPLYNFRIKSDGGLEGVNCTSEDSMAWYLQARQSLRQGRYRESIALFQLVQRSGCKHYKLFQDLSVAFSHSDMHSLAHSSARLALRYSQCSLKSPSESKLRCDTPELVLNYMAARDRIDQGMELSEVLRLLQLYIQFACARDADGNLACHGQGAARAIVECWRMGQYTCSNWLNWDVMISLLAAAVESDLMKCNLQNSEENSSLANSDACYSIVQPWEATVFPLENELVLEIARLRMKSLEKQSRILFPGQRFKYLATVQNMRVGLLVHKISGLASGLLRDFLTSPLPLAERRGLQFSFIIFSWEVSPENSSSPKHVPNVAYKSLQAVQTVIGLQMLNEFEAASRINSEGVKILMELMGWIPEGRQHLSLETMTFRPAPVQISRDVHSTSGGGPIDYLIADRIALPPELASLQPESLLLTTPSFFPNSHFLNYEFALNWTKKSANCEWDKGLFAVLGLYEYYKLDPTIFGVWARMAFYTRVSKTKV
mmetsp:Transcript_14733/g.33834  ORF Transcript_14733/g.33834 Transcript_14733/m.33834 type:complete len:517 (-) Transcript_14733:701-2251(-)